MMTLISLVQYLFFPKYFFFFPKRSQALSNTSKKKSSFDIKILPRIGVPSYIIFQTTQFYICQP